MQKLETNYYSQPYTIPFCSWLSTSKSLSLYFWGSDRNRSTFLSHPCIRSTHFGICFIGCVYMQVVFDIETMEMEIKAFVPFLLWIPHSDTAISVFSYQYLYH